MYPILPINSTHSSPMPDYSDVLEKWKQHDFFSPDTVVLGLDIGIEGIGIAVRRGTELLYCKSLLVELPEAEALANRRQMRAARHARKNRRVRMRRLQALFVKHDLPWVSDDISSKSDPFVLRHRAIAGLHPLASKEALSLCIRSCVEHRGYDYFAMSDEGNGEYPWGEKPNLPDAKKWIASAYVDGEMKAYLQNVVSELRLRDKELSEADEQAWLALVEERAAKAETAGIPAMLRKYYAHKNQYDRKGRGFNFPRAHVKDHLTAILERHKHLINDYDGFVAALFRPCLTAADKKAAIFHYNRKTPKEAEVHFEKKVKDCPYTEWLELPRAKCSLKGNLAVRRWALMDFVSNRTFELTENKIPVGRRTLPESAVRALSELMAADNLKWTEAKKALEAALLPYKLATGKLMGAEWNKGQLEQLKAIVAPDGTVRKRRASMSEAAAAKLFDIVTDGGTCMEPSSMEAARKSIGLYEQRAKIDANSGIYPQVQTLMGTLRSHGAAEKGAFAVPGFLQRLFEKELAPVLNGKTVPDYCVIECIKNPAYNKENRRQIEKEQKDNQARKLKMAERYGRENATRADFLRMRLYEEQQLERGKNAVCPFTGQDLGSSPFSSELELAHLYPDTRGGLYIAENLVLTTRKVNGEMQDRTPKEAAAAGLPGWFSWADMQKQSKKFRWGEKKRALFSFETTEGVSFPDFNNMTRTAQLARELRNRMAVWMGVAGDVEAIRCRIGNPSGSYTAAARRSFLPPTYAKDRSTTLHHRIDAALMTCIPPAEGINDVQYGGIFHTEKVNGDRRLMAMEGFPLPDFEKESREPVGCPIVKQKGCTKYQSLGDGTFWRSDKEGKLSQRTPLDADKMSAADIRATLVKMNIPATQIPSEKAIQNWLTKRTAAVQGDGNVSSQPLKLVGGTPVKNLWKFGGKGNMDKSPLGWSGIVTENGAFDQLRSLNASNDRMEIWLGWNKKKQRWEYYKRIIPTAAALAGLKRLGLPWRGRRNASPYLLNLLELNKAADLYSLICGILPPHAVKVGEIRKGDIALLDFPRDEKAVEALRKKSKNWHEDEHPATLSTWGVVSAVKSNTQIEIKCLTHKERINVKKASAEELISLFMNISKSAAELAALFNLRVPQ